MNTPSLGIRVRGILLASGAFVAFGALALFVHHARRNAEPHWIEALPEALLATPMLLFFAGCTELITGVSTLRIRRAWAKLPWWQPIVVIFVVVPFGGFGLLFVYGWIVTRFALY